MAWERAGTVSVTNGSKTVTGSGTSWYSTDLRGNAFIGPNGLPVEIESVESATSLTLATPYLGSTAAGQDYAIQPTRSRDVETTQALNTLIGDYQATKDGPGQGKFPAGTETEPGVRFDVDQDTGIRQAGSNEIALVAGGIDQLKCVGGVASGAVVQPSLFDETADLLIKTGSFGVGTVTTNGETDFDDFPLGWSLSEFNVTTNAPPFTSGRYMALTKKTSGGSIQLAFDRDTGEMAFRVGTGDFETSVWRQMFHSHNAVGTVSQSGGTPTGAVVEEGGNSNGKYTRFADGTQICSVANYGSKAPDQATGAVYSADSAIIWTYPAAFSEVPKVVSNAFGTSRWSATGTRSTTQVSGQIYCHSASASAGGMDFVAIGRWF